MAQCAGPALIAGATRAATPSTPVTPVAAPVVPPPQPKVSTFPEIPSAAIDVVATIAAAANREFAPQIDLVMGAAKALVHALKGGSSESITKEDGQNMAKQLKVFEGVLNSILDVDLHLVFTLLSTWILESHLAVRNPFEMKA